MYSLRSAAGNRVAGAASARISPKPLLCHRLRDLKRTVSCNAVSTEFKTAVDEFVDKHKVLAFIKGTKDFPQCGFSNTVVQILQRMEVPFETVDVLTDDMLRSGMKEYSQWPTFPQVYIAGEFYGGCDILLEAYQNGTLKEEVERAMLE